MRKNRVSRKLPALDLELLLSDISTNLFIVLLSVLAITSFASFSRSEKGFEIIANAEYTENSSLGLARGWSPIQQVHHRLVVRNNNLILLDLTPIAIALGNQVLFSSTNTPPNFDNTFILKNDMSPSGFALILDLSKTELPEERNL